jgi:hypothetical protein
MKTLTAFLIACFLLAAADTQAQRRVRGYMNHNGTYIMPHYATRANRTKIDNWSSKGNVNPITGKKGSVAPYKLRIRHR